MWNRVKLYGLDVLLQSIDDKSFTDISSKGEDIFHIIEMDLKQFKKLFQRLFRSLAVLVLDIP